MRRWKGLRRTVLKERPWCAVEGCHNLATQVQGLCAKHHVAKIAQQVWHRKETG